MLSKNKYYAIVEYTPAEYGSTERRILLIRERREDCESILKEIEKSNTNFEYYKIEENI